MDFSHVMKCNEKHIQHFSQKPKEKTPLGAKETGGRDVLKCILKNKYNVWPEFN